MSGVDNNKLVYKYEKPTKTNPTCLAASTNLLTKYVKVYLLSMSRRREILGRVKWKKFIILVVSSAFGLIAIRGIAMSIVWD